MKLVLLGQELEETFWTFAEELEAEGNRRYTADARRLGFDAYLHGLDAMAAGQNLGPGYVPQTSYWLIDDRVIHGLIRLRHRLTASLMEEGGNVGYVIRPSSRRRGFGTEILRLGLIEAAELGLKEVLITCDDDNLGSIRIIERNGGREYTTGISQTSAKPIRRYWIEV